jgi:hypothetical protein
MKFKLLIFVLCLLLLVTSISSYSYSRYNYLPPGGSNYGSENYHQQCEEGQDFILQIAPFGCSPSVVPSALLEEQDVTVFCQIEAFKVNPLIEIKAIEDMSINGQYPPEVRSVGFFPSRAAIDRDIYLDNSFANNIGYVAITLKQQRNASAVKEIISGNLTARIKYDIENAFSIGRATYYLPALGENEWEENRGQYSFWNNRGTLKVNEVSSNSATIEVYNENRKIAGVNLEEGKSSSYIYLPGMDCSAGFKLRLESIENPETRARINVNGESLELQKGDTFHDGKCQVKDVEKIGVLETAKISCKDDLHGRKTVELKYAPKVELEINGIVKEVSLGDLIFDFQHKGENRAVYLGYVQEVDNLGEASKLEAEFVVLKSTKNSSKLKLDSSELAMVARIAKSTDYRQSRGTETFSDLAKNGYNLVVGNIERALRGWSGETFRGIDEGQEKNIWGSDVKFVGFTGMRDVDLSGEILENYNLAILEYDKILHSFSGTRYPEDNLVTKAEEAIIEKIKLMNSLDLKRSASETCDFYKENFGEFKDSLGSACSEKNFANSGVLIHKFTINKQIVDFSLEGVYEPTFKEAGAVVYIRNVKNSLAPEKYNLELNKIVYLDPEGSFIKLVDLKQGSVRVEISMDKSFFRDIKDRAFDPEETLRIDEAKNFGSDYVFTLDEINLEEYAKVTILPKIDKNYGVANFKFTVGFEKRAIQLSPTKIKEKIEGLEESITKWEGFSSNVGHVVDGLNTACMATGAYFTLKNLFANAFFSSGEGLARNEVMNGEGRWNDYCRDHAGEYGSKEKCLLNNSDKIDSEVEEYRNLIETQNNKIKEMQKLEKYLTKSDTFGDVLNNDLIRKDYLSEVYRTDLNTNLKKIFGDSVEIQEKEIVISDFVTSLNSSFVSMDELKSLELNSQLGEKVGEGELKSLIGGITLEQEKQQKLKDYSESTGISLEKMSFVASKDYKSMPYYDLIFENVKDKFSSLQIANDVPIGIIYDASGEKYLYILEFVGDKYITKKVYNSDQEEVTSPYSFYFEVYNSKTYKNNYENPILRYYEKAPYKGLPAIVPFDIQEGWYAIIKNRAGAYDASGKVNSFYLCNVGKDGREEEMGGDDICQGFNLGTGQTYNEFPKLDTNKAKKKVDEAVDAIEEASKAYTSGVSEVKLNGIEIKVGEPKVDVPAIECTDFMSPKECNIWFNVCDPVLCPTSRCDLGGKYPVDNVIQSGIVGSIALCLPNWDEGIYLPVCMTGVKAGLDSWISVKKNYQSCLEHNLKTGEVVGVCDEIQSIYACEFFWEQAMPLVNLGKDILTQRVLGEGVRGGGEYLQFSSAFETAGKSVDFFTQSYATGSTQAFNRLDTTEIGGVLCNSFVSGTFPSAATFTRNLGKLDSPVQFYGKFEEQSFNTATNPPTSYYSVTYHIYAGENRGANFQVYLKDSGGSSYYQNLRQKRVVDSGYIPAGESATEKKDLQDVSGYNELCIRVNEYEQCGFKSVTTDFGLNYIKDQYVKSQVNDVNIQSEEECIGGTKSVYGLVNSNLQSGVENSLNPEISNYNIIRICSTSNPGEGSDELWNVPNRSKWRQVGHCGNNNLGCWLDTESIEDAVNWNSTLDESLVEVDRNFNEVLGDKAITDEEFKSILEKVKNLNLNQKGRDYLDVVKYLGELLGGDSVFFDFQRGHLYYLKGKAYSNLAEELYLDSTIGVSGIPDAVKEYDSGLEEGELGYGCEESSIIVFEVEGGLDYAYCSEGWFFSKYGDSWFGAKTIFDSLSSGEEEVSFESLFTNPEEIAIPQYGLLYEDPSPEEKEFLLKLSREDTNFELGLAFILDEFSSGRKNEIKVGEIKFDGSIFYLEEESFTNPIALKYSSEGWIWKWIYKARPFHDEWNFIAVRQVEEEIEYESKGSEIITFYLDSRLYFLEGKDFIEGAEIIFQLGATNVQLTNESDVGDYLREILKSNDVEGILGDIENENTCEACGTDKNPANQDICSQDQCLALGFKLGKTCLYDDTFWFGGKCFEEIGEIKDRKAEGEIYDFKMRDEAEVKKAIQDAGNKIVNLKCGDYAEFAVEAAKRYNIPDPLLLISILQQESLCGTLPNTYGASCPGLMQICSYELCDGNISDKDYFRDENKYRENIFCGAKILSIKYNDAKNGKLFQGCSSLNTKYYDWEAAVRGYNGWGCDGAIPEQDKYVSNVMDRYRRLVKISNR